MKSTMDFLKSEPAMAYAFVNAVLALVVNFGLDFSSAQQVSIIAVANILIGILTRQSVVPNVTYTADVKEALATPTEPSKVAVIAPPAPLTVEDMDPRV